MTNPSEIRLAGRVMRLFQARFTLRRMMIWVALAALVFSYAASYYHLSRRGMDEAAQCGMPGFLYVTLDQARESEAVSCHYALMVWYAPINWLDRTLLKGPSPVICVMRLSG